MSDRQPHPRDRWTARVTNPSPEHDALHDKLYKFAATLGYPLQRVENPAPERTVKLDPDVYIPHPRLPKVFVGDAKVAKNEGPRTKPSYQRICNYVATLARMVRDDDIHGGVLAIMTDSENLAEKWVEALDQMAIASGLTGQRGGRPDFRYQRFRGAFVISWQLGAWAQADDGKIVLPTHTEFMNRRTGR